MLYENIVLDSADSAYASQEIFVMSPNQEKEISLPLHSMTHQTWSTLLLSKMTGGKHYCRAHPFTDSVPTDGVNIQNSR